MMAELWANHRVPCIGRVHMKPEIFLLANFSYGSNGVDCSGASRSKRRRYENGD